MIHYFINNSLLETVLPTKGDSKAFCVREFVYMYNVLQISTDQLCIIFIAGKICSFYNPSVFRIKYFGHF